MLIREILKFPGVSAPVVVAIVALLLVQSLFEMANVLLLVGIIEALPSMAEQDGISMFGLSVSWFAYILVFICSTLFLMVLRYIALRYVTSVSYNVCRELNIAIARGLLSDSDYYSPGFDRSELLATVGQKTQVVAHQYVLQVLSLISNVGIFVVLIAYLLWAEPVYTSIMFSIVVGCYASIMYAVKRRLVSLGATVSNAQSGVMQIFNKIMDLRVPLSYTGSFQGVLNALQSRELVLRGSLTNMHVVTSSPRVLIEGIVLSMFAGVLLVMLGYGADFDISGLILLAVAFQRLLPLVQLIYASWSNISGVKKIKSDVMRFHMPDSLSDRKARDFNPSVLSILRRHLQLFPKHTITVSPDRFRIGQKVLMQGESGVGKSMLLAALANRTARLRAALALDEVAYNRVEREWFFQHTYYMPQDDALVEGSVLENILIGLEPTPQRMDVISSLLLGFGLTSIAEENSVFLSKIITEESEGLSGGQIQRVLLIRALLEPRRIYLLDEATSGLDEDTEHKVINKMFETRPESTFIMISHNKNIEAIFDVKIKVEKEYIS